MITRSWRTSGGGFGRLGPLRAVPAGRFAYMSIEMDLLPDTRRALVHRLATGQVQGRAPSVVAAVVRDGRPLWMDGYGSVDGAVPDGDIQYRIGSITKMFVAVLV